MVGLLVETALVEEAEAVVEEGIIGADAFHTFTSSCVQHRIM